ncbi:flagellin [Alsobacter soli]|uniref:Flagellin n=1 Tax=Alsobacter soli TaxID=2109933 RepID=A0A2T1HU79_9HYPH|nr:flagellin [Alsobacter soli]PSC05216.1 flagellin [Alsobacter soli]
MANIVLSQGVRNNLLSLQDVAAQSTTVQQRLATGRKVNSAVDNAVNYFANLGLNDRANQLTGLLDGISNGIQTIQAASKGIDAITKLVQQAQSTIKQAQADALTSHPSATGTSLVALADKVGAMTKKDVALNKTLGATTTPTTTDYSSGNNTAGDLGMGLTAGNVNVLTITAGSTTYTTSNLSATSTVRDVVDEINKSGIATASVDENGKLTVTGTGSSTLTIGIGTATPAGSTPAQMATAYNSALANAQTNSGATNLIGSLGLTVATVGAGGAGLTSTANSTVRASLVSQFNSLLTQIDQLAKDAGYNGTNLLDGNTLSVVFNEKTGSNRNKLDVVGQTVTAANLGIQQASSGAGASTTNFQDDASLDAASDALTNALASLRSMASTFGSNLSVVQTRQDFTKNMVTTLQTGADNLVNADQNAEAANLLALQTRQQLSQTALSLSNQADQGVLRLFG